MNVSEKVRQIKNGTMSSVRLCRECLAAIEENDLKGRGLNAVAAIASDWYEQAKALDEDPDKGSSDKLLYGIPVLVKDNIEVRGMVNSAGSYVLRDLVAEDDSFIVKKLREAGAVILGKCNLSEFAYWMSDENMPCGYSSLNGQVVHPYNPSFDPSGSSSGSAVAAAAGYCDLTVGTETDGSLMYPAVSNGIVSIKPTTGLTSRCGILPLSEIQDSAGPMGRSVSDCALLLQAMAGIDEKDPASSNAEVKDYLSELKCDLSGRKIGVFTVKDLEYDKKYQELLKQTIIENGGEVFEFEYEKASIDEYECLFTEFKYSINKYLSDRKCKARNLKDIIRMNEEDPERCLKYGQGLLIKSEESSGSLEDETYRKLRDSIDRQAHELLDGIIDKNSLSCLVSVCSVPPSNLAVLAGGCSMVIPAKEVNEKEYAPLSYYLLGKANRETDLIRLAYTLEKKLDLDCRPSWLKEKQGS